MKLAGFFLFVFALPQCSKSKMDNPPYVNLNDCGKYVYNSETTRLCFDELITDSRCPANVVCVWEGIAVAKFTFQKGNEQHTFQLATRPLPNQYSKDTVLNGYKIELINLLPYPGTETGSSKPKAEVKVTPI